MSERKAASRPKRFRSIRMRFTAIFIVILMIILGSLILVDATVLEKYTIHSKLIRIQTIAEGVTAYIESDLSDESLVELEQLTHKSNVNLVVLKNLNTLPQVLYATDINEGGRANSMVDYFYGQTPTAMEIYSETDKYIIYKSYDKRLNTYQIDCIGMAGENIGFIMSTPLESIRETVQLTNRLLLTLGGIAALLGAFMIYLATASLTKPIQRLSHISKEMADLNFDIRYEGNRGDEIGVLGENMNQMSSNLEETIRNLKTANEQLELDLLEKERIDEMRRQFLSNVSHELKTPIALIQGYSEGLKDGISDDPESMDFYCDVIIDEAQKMNQIVKRLLNLDEIETGHVHVEKDVFNISEVLIGVARTGKKLAESDCELNVDVDPEVLVYADQFMIEQAIQNYISNAYHYVNVGGTVTVRTECQNESVRVCVHNTGSHIPEEDIEHVWDKFYKVDKARTRAYGGSGIGLSIVKAIMTNHHAAYGVRNYAEGVEFWFELPIYVRQDPDMESGDA